MEARSRSAPAGAAFESAAQHAITDFPVAAPGATAAEIVAMLRQRRFESVADVAVCEGTRLAGLVRIEVLLSATPGATAAALMDADPPVVAPGLDQEVAAWKAVRHGESSLAVVDADGRFVGLVPPHRLLGVLLWEHDEDMARLGGFMRGTSEARTATEEPVRQRFWHRLPWLLAGLLGALLAANIVGGFEDQLRENVTIAFFIPGIVYLADAVGTQTEALIIRGLSVGVSIERVVRREIVTGLLVGSALALAFFPIGAVGWGETDVAAAVSISLLAACSTATLVAMALPWAFHKLGRDPAFGSGPLATVIQDIMSVTIYLVTARALVG